MTEIRSAAFEAEGKWRKAVKQYLLFDLDGTLTDPKTGITTCVQYALKDQGIEEPDLDKLEPFIGPPLKDSFREFYHLSEEDADRAVEKYRERFRDTGIFENELYGGIHDLLRTLKAGGMHLAVASSKPTVYVEQILKHFKIDKYFEVVIGSELDGTRVEKAQVIQEALHRLFGDRPVQYDQVYMIGDRKFDIEGARTLRIESVGVTYGYGSMEELKEAKADYIVRSVAELKKLLMREVEEAKRQQEEKKNTSGSGKPKKGDTKIVWKMFLPLIMYYLMRLTAMSFLKMILQIIGNSFPAARDFLIAGETDTIITFSDSVVVVLEAVSTIVAVAFIFRIARVVISKTADEMKLSHLKKDPVKAYVILGFTALGAVIGMNLLISLIGMTDSSESYQAVSEIQYSAPFLLGIICYGLITPVAEEILFRGIVYNYMKKFTGLKFAIVLSAFIFSAFHGNSVQGMYSFVIGCLMAYAYDYFGSFYVPVAIHVGANVLVYTLSVLGVGQTAFVSWPVCIVALIMAAAGFFLLHKEKKIW